ncbi:retrotransposable element Tf2 [Tanacetum coccineum]
MLLHPTIIIITTQEPSIYLYFFDTPKHASAATKSNTVAECDQFTVADSGLAFCDKFVGYGSQAQKGQLIKSQSILGLFGYQNIAITRSMAAKRTGGDYGSRIESNAQSIAKVGDMVLGLSTQLTNFMKRGKIKLDDIDGESDEDDKLEDSGCSLVDLIEGLQMTSPQRRTSVPAVTLSGDDTLTIAHSTQIVAPIYMTNRKQVTPSWKQYVKDITSRFGAPYDDPIAELMELKQTVLNEDISNMYTFGHNCRGKRPQLFHLEVEEEEYDGEGELEENDVVVEIPNEDFKWKMHSIDFSIDLNMLWHLGGSDMVLGIQWFVTLGKVTFDFDNRCIEFDHKGRKVVLRGSDDKPIQTVGKKKMRQTIQQGGEICMLQVLAVEGEEYSNDLQVKVVADAPVSKDIQQLIQKNEQIFQDPVNLPPFSQATWNSDPVLHKLISELQLNPSSHSRYQWTGKELRRNNKLVIGNDTTLKQKLLHWMHNSPQGGHSGIPATLKRIQSLFYRPKLRTDVHTYIKECEVCQKCKANLAASPGLLQPLPIPKGIWEDIAMDFIKGFPISKGKSVILVVIDRLTYHPQSDGQSEVLNRCLEGYLRCMCFTKPNDWVNWLPLAEYWYNTSFHTATKHTPFEIVYGQKPPLHLPYLPGESKVEALDRSLQAREETIQQLKENLSRSQNMMKQFADRHRSERSYQVGEWVYLKLQPYRQSSVEFRSNQKIAAKYYGPFPIIVKIGQVAYTLQLPLNSAIHPTYHVSLLKPHHGTLPDSSTLPSTHEREHTSKVLAKVLEIRTVKKNNAAHVEWLVQCKDETEEATTWESAASIDTLYPNFDPWGQGSS